MNISKTIFLNCLLLSSFASQSSAMESDDIEYDLSIIPILPTYAAGFEDEKEQLNVQDNDMMIHILVSNRERNGRQQKATNSLMPKELPYSLLQGKEEGKKFSIKIYGTSFVFHLNQLKYSADTVPFEQMLEQLKADFLKKPSFLPSAETILLEKRIIVKNGSKYLHGLNGFKDE
jgi:hypothetical protein